MAKQDVNRDDVLAATAEFDGLGQDAFLAKYGMGKATGYLLHYGGKEYDSKAILAAAHGHHLACASHVGRVQRRRKRRRQVSAPPGVRRAAHARAHLDTRRTHLGV